MSSVTTQRFSVRRLVRKPRYGSSESPLMLNLRSPLGNVYALRAQALDFARQMCMSEADQKKMMDALNAETSYDGVCAKFAEYWGDLCELYYGHYESKGLRRRDGSDDESDDDDSDEESAEASDSE